VGKLADLVAARGAKLQAMVTCGFELETQMSEELTRKAYMKAATTVRNYNSDQHEECVSRYMVRNACSRAEAEHIHPLANFVSERMTFDEFFQTPPRLIEVVADTSVKGFEFRTIGGLSTKKFMLAAASVFSLDHKIDPRCSFHIHLGLPDIEFGYSEKVQAAMIEYLTSHIKDMPRTVRTRLKRIRKLKWFQGLISQEKYSFINFHDQGTWEFRCFGNVKSAKDAEICLRLAIKALQYGYSMQASDKTTRLDKLDRYTWQQAVFTSCETGRTLAQTLTA